MVHLPFTHPYNPLSGEHKERLILLRNRDYFQSSVSLIDLIQVRLHMKTLGVFPESDLHLFSFGRGKGVCLCNLCGTWVS